MDLAEGHVAALKKLQSNHIGLQVTYILQYVANYKIIYIMKIWVYKCNKLYR